jgi:hypothetical protein
MADEKKTKRFTIALALAGIAIEVAALLLLSSERIGTSVAVPLIVAGMFLAFAPVFLVARRARRR